MTSKCNETKFRKVQSGVYAGGGCIISRDFNGNWVVKSAGQRLMWATTLKAAQKWVASR